MSSTDGLEILRNWQKRGAELSLTSVSPKGRMRIFEVSAWILSVGESKLALLNIQSEVKPKHLIFAQRHLFP